VTPREPFRPPSSGTRRRPLPEAGAALLTLVAAAACASFRPPAPGVAERAAAAGSYSASLRVSVSGADLRGGSRALVAFRRPDALRIEIPGPSGARLVAVARDGRLVAVLPSERAVLEREARPEELQALLGVALSPGELMDVLVGTPPEGLREYRADWGPAFPRRIVAVLADGTKLRATVEESDDGTGVAAAAFDAPVHEGFRPVDADEARRLLGGR